MKALMLNALEHTWASLKHWSIPGLPSSGKQPLIDHPAWGCGVGGAAGMPRVCCS